MVEVLGGAMGGAESDEGSGVPVELINEIKETEFAKTVLSGYSEGIVAALKGDEIPEGLSEEEILALIDKDIDDLVNVVKEFIPEEEKGKLTDDELKTFVKEGVGELAKSLPTVEEVVTMVKVEEVVPAEVKVLFGPKVTIALAVVALVLAGIIYALRFWRFGGFMWIGVSTVITALLVGGLSLGGATILSAFKESAGAFSGLLDTASLVITGKLNIALIILVVLAVVFIAGYILLRKYAIKKPLKEATSVVETETQEIVE